MIDPRTVRVAIPSYGPMQPEVAGALVACVGLYGAVSIPTECSHVSLVRNMIAAEFLASPFEWLVCWDNDIVPSRRDMELLLEPCVSPKEYQAGQALVRSGTESDTPTRVVVSQSSDLCRGIDSKTLGAADALVCAQYTYKDDSLRPCHRGMGFVRIHRSVFEALQQLRHPLSESYAALSTEMSRVIDLRKRLTDEGKEEWVLAMDLDRTIKVLQSNLPDPGGGPRLWQISHKGRVYHDYFPSGPILSMHLPVAQWMGEDHGFFTLCALAGIVVRDETRTRLVHIGRKGYHYQGADVGGGQ